MNYANPIFNAIFFAMTLLALFYLWAMRRRRILLERFAERRLISGITSSSNAGRRIFKIALMLIAVFLALLALARPQWGFEWQEVKKSGIDILIAMDVSKSMLARDVRPNRLERSKYAVKDLTKRLSGDRIGLIAFAGTAFLQCPLTIDYNGFLLALDDLTTATIPRGGTSISQAIEEAMRVFSGPEKKYRALIIITDGEELEGDALSKAKKAAGAGIKIYCVGVGSGEGELIPVIDERGEKAYVADREGNAVKTRLNEELLKNIAISTGGSYVRATGSDFGLTLLYDKAISKLEKRDIESAMRKHYEERFQIFLALAIAILFLEPMVSAGRRLAR